MKPSNRVSSKKPKTIVRERDCVVVSWEGVFSGDENKIVLQLKNDIKHYETIYKGLKTSFKINNVAHCSCYELRIKPESGDEWIEFKTATQSEGLYLVMHVTRAIQFGKTPLLRKIAHSRPYLLEVENREHKTPLVQAIEKGDLALVHLLLNLGANVNTVNLRNLRSPLMVAVFLKRLQIASFLVDKGADVHLCDVVGLNVLHYAVDSGSVESVEWVLKLGADVDSRDFCGWTPLLRAVILGCGKEMVEVLLENGADKEVKDKNGFDFEKHLKLASA